MRPNKTQVPSFAFANLYQIECLIGVFEVIPMQWRVIGCDAYLLAPLNA